MIRLLALLLAPVAASAAAATIGCSGGAPADTGLLGGALVDFQFYNTTLSASCLQSLMGGTYADACVANVVGLADVFTATFTLQGYTVSLFGSAETTAMTQSVAALAGASPSDVVVTAVTAAGFGMVNVSVQVAGGNVTVAQARRQALASVSSTAAQTTMTTGGLARLTALSTYVAPGVVQTYPTTSATVLTLGLAAATTAAAAPDPFVCGAPTTSLSANATFVQLLLDYGSAWGTAAVPYGRTPFLFATFNAAQAASPPSWDPTSLPATNLPFGASNPRTTSALTSYSSADAYMFPGSCSLAAASASPYATTNYATAGGAPGFPFAGNLTQQAAPFGAVPSDTPGFVGTTVQAAGCACAVYSVGVTGLHQLADNAARNANRSAYPCLTSSAAPAGDSVFWAAASPQPVPNAPLSSAAAASGGWALRQYGGGGGVCAARTQALFAYPLNQLKTLPFVTASNFGGTQVTYWDVWTVEVGSTASWNVNSTVMDSLTTRTLPHRQLVTVLTAGAVVTSVAPGGMMQQAIPVVTAQYATRLDASTAALVLSLNLLVRQPDGANGAGAFTVLDQTILSANPPTVTVPGFTSICTALTAAPDNAWPTTAGYACATTACTPVPQTQLPAEALVGFNPNTLANSVRNNYIIYLTTIYILRLCRIYFVCRRGSGRGVARGAGSPPA
jgi:hypothetical protein